MLTVSLRRLLFAGVLAVAVMAAPAPAFAGGSPDQHDDQYISGDQAEGLVPPLESLTSLDCENGQAGPYPCKNVDLASSVPLPEFGLGSGNDVWGWTDPRTGREYAIVGTALSTGFVDVTNPENPKVVGELPTAGIPDFVLWRDIKVDGHYAFIVSEVSRHGMQVFDLRRLRGAGPTPTVFDADANYRGMDSSGEILSNSHNISINRKTDYAYLVGTNTCDNGEEAGGLHMVDISDPLKPRFAGCAIVRDADGDDETESNNYVHDVDCEVYTGPDRDFRGREICFGSNENAVVIYDVTRKKRPKVLSQTTYPTAAYTHQGSLTQDQEHFIFGDELDEGVLSSGGGGTVDNTTTYILRAGKLRDPGRVKAHAHGTTAIDHNLYIHGRRIFQSNYTAGLRIQTFNDRTLKEGRLREIGYFDVFPAGDPNDFAGTWSNYRFNSGTVVVSSIEDQLSGLFVLRPDLPDRTDGRKGNRPCPRDEATIEGTSKSDTIRGTSGRDVILSHGGNDEVFGRGGNDRICDGRGADEISGGRGADRIHGRRGADFLKGQKGADRLRGGPGRDKIRGGPGNDSITGGPGADDSKQ
ncbi:MAG: choice-of-anchor B family protein [Thermoleophilaceae bacterium]